MRKNKKEHLFDNEFRGIIESVENIDYQREDLKLSMLIKVPVADY